MLIEFSVGNYRSFKNVVTLSMEATTLKARDEAVDENNVFEAGKNLRLLKSAAIYGANASGKSNLVRALRFMRSFVLNSSRDSQAGDAIDVEEFRLSTEAEGEPSYFQVVFLMDDKQYTYGFEVDKTRVIAEWLYHIPSTKEAILFERDPDSTTWVKRGFKEGKDIEEKTRGNALFLSVVAQFNGTIARQILRWFEELDVSFGMSEGWDEGRAMFEFENGTYQEEVQKLVTSLDLDVDRIELKKSTRTSTPSMEPSEGITITSSILRVTRAAMVTYHKKWDAGGIVTSQEKFLLGEHESEGTKKLVALAIPLIHTLKQGGVLIVDELDARLHPLMTCAIVQMFNSSVTNPNNAQMIFTTHDTNLLDKTIFRRDQIWFTEKDRYGATQLYSLAEFKLENEQRVRNDASFEKDYIQGRYGAIPFLGDLTRLLGDENG